MNNPRRWFFEHQAQTSNFPLALEITKAEGVYLYNENGKKYLDAIAGIGVSNLGHCNPKIVQAVQQQAATYMHTMVYGEYIQHPSALLSKKISDSLPENLNQVYFVNSGAEAIEAAIKLCKKYTQRSKVFSMKNAYHGSTNGALSIMGNEGMKRNFRPLLPNCDVLRFNNLEDIEKIDEHTSAVFVEPIAAESGIHEATAVFLNSLQNQCKKNGVLLVFDEIQTGMGRTGNMWALEKYNVIPDVLLAGKALGGGLPLGALISDKKILHCFTNNPILGHITTFGGNAVCCAAALASFDVINNTDFLDAVKEKGDYLNEKIKHKAIREVRGTGLFIALQLDTFEQTKKVIDICLADGLIVDWFLFCDNALRIAPPLTISYDEIDFIINTIHHALES